MAPNGRGQRRLTRSRARDYGPAWSPDGRRLVFTSNRTGRGQVYVMKTGTAQYPC
jgi:TolB protein